LVILFFQTSSLRLVLIASGFLVATCGAATIDCASMDIMNPPNAPMADPASYHSFSCVQEGMFDIASKLD